MPPYFACTTTPGASTLMVTNTAHVTSASGYIGAPPQLVEHAAAPETHWHEEHFGVESLLGDPFIVAGLAAVGAVALVRRARQLSPLERFSFHIRGP